MIKTGNRQGFSLVEAMMAVTISLIVIGGLANTMRKVQTSVRNAASGSDMSNATRSLAKLMRNDFANAGRGFGDLLAIEARYQFNEDFVDNEREVDIMYAIDTVNYGDAAYVPDTSNVVLHWFDYDIAGTNQRTNPSFLVNMPDGDWPDDGNYNMTVELYSADQSLLQTLESGDIFLFYKHEILTDTELFTAGEAIWNRETDMADGDDHVKNSGAILQLAEVGEPIASTDEDLRDMFYVEVTFDPDGTFFTNSMPENPNNTRFPGYNFTEDLGVAITENNSSYPALPPEAHVARKLGNSDSFHRVQYHVEQATTEDPAVLIRTHNGSREVIATNVTQFLIDIGVDVAPAMDPANVQKDDMDGYVSIADPLNWSRSQADYGLTLVDYTTVVGRHAVSAQVSFTQEGLTDDRSDTTRSTGKKTRSFVEQFRIWNNTLPMSQL